MLGIVADFIAGIVTILFPVFASYKALKASDPADLAPWCIYWIVLSLILLAESWTVFIIGWLPFYSWIRLILLSYLVLPQTQGAKILYFNYISPFIEQHEHDIEAFIANSHERATTVGLAYLKKLIDLVREKVLGLPPPQETQPPPPRQQSYSSAAAQYSADLLRRFSIPQARMPPVPAGTDLYSLLSSAVSAATAKPSTATRSSPLVPENLSSPNEKLSFIAAQREKLGQLLYALDREQSSITTEQNIEADIKSRMSNMDPTAAVDAHLKQKRNKSEHSFENIERDEYSATEAAERKAATAAAQQGRNRRTVSSGWMPTWLGGGQAASEEDNGETIQKDDTASHQSQSQYNNDDDDDGRGRTSGFDSVGS